MRPSGQLRRGTLAEVLLEAERSQLTGSVAVIADDRQGKVYVFEGRITHARQSVQREFDDWLALLGLIPADDPTVATDLASRLGTDLAINAPMIRRLGREYVDRVCADLFRLEEGEYRIQEGEMAPHGVIESWKVAQVLLNAAATGHADKLDTRPSSRDVRLKATTEPEVVLSRAEWRLVVEMSQPASPEALADAVGAEPRSVRRVLTGLRDRDLLIAGPGARLTPAEAPLTSPTPAPIPSPAAAPAPAPVATDADGTPIALTGGGLLPSTNGNGNAVAEHGTSSGSTPRGSLLPGPDGNGHAVAERGTSEVDADDTAPLSKSKRASALRRLMSQMRE